MHAFTARMTRVLVFGAVFAAMILAVRHGLEKGADAWSTTALVIALGLVAVAEFLSWHNAACSFFERRLGGVVLWGTLGCFLTMGVVWTNFSSAASNNDSRAGIQKAAFVQQIDVGDAITEKSAEVKRLQDRVRMKPTRTPEGARQAQDNAKAHRYWKSTDGCTNTLGPATRKFCDEYRSAVADESLATAILLDEEALKVAMRDLTALRDQRSHQGKAVMGEDQPALRWVANYAGVSLGDVRLMDSVVLTWMIQAMVLFGGLAIAREAYLHQPRVTWVDWPKWGRRLVGLRDFVTGKPMHQAAAMPAPHRADAPYMPGPVSDAAGVTLVQQRYDDRKYAQASAQILGAFRNRHQAQPQALQAAA